MELWPYSYHAQLQNCILQPPICGVIYRDSSPWTEKTRIDHAGKHAFDLCFWFSDELRELIFVRRSWQAEAEAPISVVILIKWEVRQLQDKLLRERGGWALVSANSPVLSKLHCQAWRRPYTFTLTYQKSPRGLWLGRTQSNTWGLLNLS